MSDKPDRAAWMTPVMGVVVPDPIPREKYPGLDPSVWSGEVVLRSCIRALSKAIGTWARTTGEEPPR